MQIPLQSNYREIHQPLPGNPLGIKGKLSTIGKSISIMAKGFSGTLDSGINIGVRLLIFEIFEDKKNLKITAIPRLM